MMDVKFPPVVLPLYASEGRLFMSVATPSDSASAQDVAGDSPIPPQSQEEAETRPEIDAEEAQPAETKKMSVTLTSVPHTGLGPHDDRDSVDLEEAEKTSDHDNAMEISGIPPNDVKNIILQVLSPYFDDDGGEDDAQRYDHIKAQGWIQLICDGIMEKLLGMRRPYKYVVHCMIMRKCGAGIHVCSSCYYNQADGWVNHAHDLSAHIYAVVTVYWSVI
ncbi:dynein light chain, putative [Trypanosoma cruzi marinkellei]|uniref:Dynein light chain, putative n=1 Tax=Trypanosoma cruzi marinkellei TaxID=85056 RepID=K2NQS6_TRYCR|nr:dynein light chain, putative [Trypanosoma cruzi marinkellei]